MKFTLPFSGSIKKVSPTAFFRNALLVFSLVLSSGSLFAQPGYTVVQEAINPAFAPLPAAPAVPSKTIISPTSGTHDGFVETVSLPFSFDFNGVAYNDIHVSLNGFATFGTAPDENEIFPLSTATPFGGVISLYGWDLDLAASAAINISHHTVGTPGSQIFKVEWMVRRSSNNGVYAATDTNNFVFQLWLFEGTNVIEMNYLTFAPSANVERLGQIGLRGPDYGVIALEYTALFDWPSGGNFMTVTNNPLSTVRTRNFNGRVLAGSNRTFRWTPVSCFAPSGVVVSGLSPTSVNVDFTPPSSAPSNGYQYYLSTNATPPTGATVPTGIITDGMNLTGLTSGATYYLYIRSNCGAEQSTWTSVVEFSTLCAPVNPPYYLGFDPFSDGFTVPALPTCTTNQNLGAGSNWVTEGANMGAGYFDEHLVYNGLGGQAANTWFYTGGINLVAGTTYRLSYLYGGSNEFSYITNKLKVAYGTSPTAAAMVNTLANHPDIKDSPIENIVNFTPTVTGTYYFGFHANSAANMGKLYVDDIQVVEPGCIKPVNAATGTITGTTALVTWDVPSPVPAGGYAYYISTSNTPPVYTQAASGLTSPGTNVVTITGLTANTTYHFWVRGVCGANDFSEWSSILTFTTLNPPVYTYCTPAPTSVDGSGIVNVTIGTINNSTGTEPGNYGNYSSMITNVSQGAAVPISITFNTFGWDYQARIWIDWNNNSSFADAGENVVTQISVAPSPHTLNAVINVPAGAILGEHRMRIGASDIESSFGSDLSGYGAGQGPCYTGAYAAFEDYTINVVVPPPHLEISENGSTQCALQDSPLITLVSDIDNYDTYTWVPDVGVTGDAVNGWTINNSSSITYTLTANQTSLPFSTNSVSFTYTANAIPTPIVLTPDVLTSCESGPAVQIAATGGVVAGIPVYYEDFNGSAPGWISGVGTLPTAHSGGNVNLSRWTLRPNGYNPGGLSGISSVVSNDATQFYISNSDAQGSGTQTNVVLTSPVFSLAGYTSASMSFFHHYKPYTNGYARVYLSSNGGASWTQIFNWGDWNATTDQGTPTNFANVVYNLDAYAGNANMRVRFEYYVQWGFVWAIDNFLVSGSATSAITWDPPAGLYTDAAATIPYVAGTGVSTVYAMPTTTTTYTASASTPSPTICSTETTAEVTVTPIQAAAVTPATQSVCGNATPLTLASGYTGTVSEWQWSNSPVFATFTSIPSSASATLSTAQIGSFSGIRYFRPVITTGSCNAYGYATTGPVTYASVSMTSSTWNGVAWNPAPPTAGTAAIFAGNYTSSGPLLEACSVQVNSGTVTFLDGHTLRVTNAVNVAGGSLNFNNNASLVQINDDAVNSGFITYRRNSQPMVAYDYTYWSSPLSPQTLSEFSPLTLSDKYFRFDTAANNYVSVPGISPMDKGRGYIIRAPENFTSSQQPFLGVFGTNAGTPNNGLVNVPIVLSGANNFNLIGNPYPSAIDADLFYSENSGLIDGNFYFWTHNTEITSQEYTGSDYAVWNSTGGIGTEGGGTGNSTEPDGNIAAGQGFFVMSIANGTAEFNNSMRLTGLNNIFFRMDGSQNVEPAKSRVWLELKNNQGAYKQTLVGYLQDATNQKDLAFDADAVEAGNIIGFYSIVDQSKLGIQGRALPFDINDQVPLGYRSSIAGTFVISLAKFDGLFGTQDIYLEDKLLNVIHDLRSGDYTFTTQIGTFDTRFVLRYNGASLGNNDPEFDNAVVVYKNDGGIHVHTGSVDMASVKIFDIRGRVIAERSNINENITVFSGLNIAEQVLIVQVTSVDGKKSSKKIVY